MMKVQELKDKDVPEAAKTNIEVQIETALQRALSDEKFLAKIEEVLMRSFEKRLEKLADVRAVVEAKDKVVNLPMVEEVELDLPTGEDKASLEIRYNWPG